jgi:hypothetical protein
VELYLCTPYIYFGVVDRDNIVFYVKGRKYEVVGWMDSFWVKAGTECGVS